ncbi:N-acetyltransferase ESCO1 [Zea mays]|uniref:N-acetyltransferase ESCO1 n=1 Tax=Zea mays TaxID=4577 RepID=A0A1D6E712_MAIZE|nr:N-acetyltransferase ESCO1 [Zea mays]
MQPKISAFFERQETDPDPISGDGEGNGQGNVGAATEAKRKANGCRLDGLVSKKRNYAQLHLELGQPDFVLHTCSVCGMMYARGNDEDEKVHRAYHKSYSEGVPFKVREVITVVEKELGFGEGKLLHKLCKVYLYISAQRIVGCLVTEPIKTGHRVIPSSTEGSPNDLPVSSTERGKNGHTLEFGSISFKREIIRRHSRSVKNKEECQDPGAILCETEAVPALCGFRAIWVAPSCRRKRIASKLMDVARKTFCEGRTLGISQFAFSPPTSSGKGLACRYCKTSAFLVYKDGPV